MLSCSFSMRDDVVIAVMRAITIGILGECRVRRTYPFGVKKVFRILRRSGMIRRFLSLYMNWIAFLRQPFCAVRVQTTLQRIFLFREDGETGEPRFRDASSGGELLAAPGSRSSQATPLQSRSFLGAGSLSLTRFRTRRSSSLPHADVS